MVELKRITSSILKFKDPSLVWISSEDISGDIPFISTFKGRLVGYRKVLGIMF